MVFVAFLAAAIGIGEAQPSIGPEFTEVLAAARLDADCYRGCSAAPVASDRSLDVAMANAYWRIEKPDDYVTAFRAALGKYLLDKRLRPRIDATFTSKDSLYFETALNVLPTYLTCVEAVMRSSPDASFVNSAAIDRLLDKADAACVEERIEALERIGFTSPAFHKFNYVADVGKPGGEVSSLLQHVQHFAVAYNVGLRGATWRKSIDLIVLPTSTRLTVTAQPEKDRVSLPCNVGPVERTFGGGPWKVYSCSDGVSVILISANSTSNVPFTYMLSLSRPAPFMVFGDGVPGDGTDLPKATQELRRLTAQDIAAMISATKSQGTARPSSDKH